MQSGTIRYQTPQVETCGKGSGLPRRHNGPYQQEGNYKDYIILVWLLLIKHVPPAS